MGTIDAGGCILEPWAVCHIPGLVVQANDAEVSATLTDLFPYPYTEDDAAWWVDKASSERPTRNFAIVVDGEVAGGAGVDLLTGTEQGGADIGYWLGRSFWGRGLATTVLLSLTDYAFAVFDLRRLQAGVFSWNLASARVLEKAGYHLEGRHRQAIFKRGRVGDRLMYGRLRTDPAPPEG